MTASPATMPCCSAPMVTATSPVTMPTRIARSGTPRSAPIAAIVLTSSSPARTARSASSSCVVGHAPDRHHGVADELLDGAAVAGDDLPALLEVARQQLAHLLLVAGLRQAGEADEVAEQHAGDPPRGDRLGRSGGCRRAPHPPAPHRSWSRSGRRGRSRRHTSRTRTPAGRLRTRSRTGHPQAGPGFHKTDRWSQDDSMPQRSGPVSGFTHIDLRPLRPLAPGPSVSWDAAVARARRSRCR